mmetsp:Transcript_20698/g.62391  ORF Transcript_20698/g.62391 Transcript_20698/m.62391 type:complete len:82 (+) Transcript_20698:936-1181(+)
MQGSQSSRARVSAPATPSPHQRHNSTTDREEHVMASAIIISVAWGHVQFDTTVRDMTVGDGREQRFILADSSNTSAAGQTV